MTKKDNSKKSNDSKKVVVAISHKRVQTAAGKRRAALRDTTATKSKAA